MSMYFYKIELCTGVASCLNVRKLFPGDNFTECGLSESDSDLHVVCPQGDLKGRPSSLSLSNTVESFYIMHRRQNNVVFLYLDGNFEILVTLTL